MPIEPPDSLRCPECGQQASALQTHCLQCNARILEPPPSTGAQIAAFPATPPVPPSDNGGTCPGCGREFPGKAVLCIECGYDRRTGRKLETIHAAAHPETDTARLPSQRPALSAAGLGIVRIGLGLHYARLTLMLAAGLVIIGLLCFLATVGADADHPVAVITGLAVIATVLFAAFLGVIGSMLCLWVGRASGAWRFIFLSLILDALTPPLLVCLRLVDLPSFFGWVCQFVSWILFMLFLRRLAVCVDRLGEANEIMVLITRAVALFVAVPLLLVLLGQGAVLSVFFLGLVVPAQAILVLGAMIVIAQAVFMAQLYFSILSSIRNLREAIASVPPRREADSGEHAAAPPDRT